MALVILDDNARAFTVTAAGVLSAGQFVEAINNTDQVNGSGASVNPQGGYTATSIGAGSLGTPANYLGIVLSVGSAVSGGVATVAFRGIYVVKAAGAVTAGAALTALTYDSVVALNAGSGTFGFVGRALTGTSASGNYLVARLI